MVGNTSQPLWSLSILWNQSEIIKHSETNFHNSNSLSHQQIFIDTKRTAQTDSLRSVTALTLCWIKISKIPDYSANSWGRLQYHLQDYIFCLTYNIIVNGKEAKNLPILKRIFNKFILKYSCIFTQYIGLYYIILNLPTADWSRTAVNGR